MVKGGSMKKIGLTILCLVMMATMAHAQDIKILGRDYSWRGDVANPIGVGAITWSDEEYDFEPGIYGQILFGSYKEIVRFSMGMVVIWDDDKPGIRPSTALTFGIPIGNDDIIEIGAYYAPFWGLDSRSDDPWGFMLGYGF
jgi:hypothetical protein